MKTLYIALVALAFLTTGCQDKKESQNSTDISNIIIDNAHLLKDDSKFIEYRAYNSMLLSDFDIDFRTITTTSDEDIDMFANREFNKLQQQSRSKSAKAILLVVNSKQDKVRMEVSMALEPIYTDAFVSYIQRVGFVPYFRDNKISDGIYMATELIVDRAFSHKKEFVPPNLKKSIFNKTTKQEATPLPKMPNKSIGAGAKTKANIAKKDPNAKKGANIASSSSDSPKDVLKKYLKSLKEHNTNPNLDIYTKQTQRFFANHTVTKINQDNEVKFLVPCMDSKVVKYSPDSTHAVVMNDPVRQRTCTPHFFKKEQGKWKLDIATMAQVLRFNVPMQWHFDLSNRLKGEAKYYAFAFNGYKLDTNGYLHIPKKKKPDNLRYGYECNGYFHPGDRREDMRCTIRYIYPGSPASIMLGLDFADKIYAVGEGSSYKENATMQEFSNYLSSVPSGGVVKYTVEHYYLNGKETYKFDDILNPNVKIKYEKREGIAP
jgi:uncharacterized protein